MFTIFSFVQRPCWGLHKFCRRCHWELSNILSSAMWIWSRSLVRNLWSKFQGPVEMLLFSFAEFISNFVFAPITCIKLHGFFALTQDFCELELTLRWWNPVVLFRCWENNIIKLTYLLARLDFDLCRLLSSEMHFHSSFCIALGLLLKVLIAFRQLCHCSQF